MFGNVTVCLMFAYFVIVPLSVWKMVRRPKSSPTYAWPAILAVGFGFFATYMNLTYHGFRLGHAYWITQIMFPILFLLGVFGQRIDRWSRVFFLSQFIPMLVYFFVLTDIHFHGLDL